jgi:hypothetical protein
MTSEPKETFMLLIVKLSGTMLKNIIVKLRYPVSLVILLIFICAI